MDSFYNTGIKCFFSTPSEFGFEFGSIDGVTAIMPCTVFDIGDERFVRGDGFRTRAGMTRYYFIQEGADTFNDLVVIALIASADVIDFSTTSAVIDQIDPFAVITHKEPVTDVFTVTVYGDILTRESFADDSWDQFFVMLFGTVVVRAVGDNGVHPISMMI